MIPRCVLFDLDDTLIAEVDYFAPLIRQLERELCLSSEAVRSLISEFRALRHTRADILKIVIERFGIATKVSHDDLYECLRSVSTPLSLRPHAQDLINECLRRGMQIHVLTNGVPEIQRNKWHLLAIAQKSQINFTAARDLGADKPAQEVFESWREGASVKWSDVLAIGDRYETDIAYPIQHGADGRLVNPYSYSSNNSSCLVTDLAEVTRDLQRRLG